MQRQKFSDTEWMALLQAPTQAVLDVVLADKTDPVSSLKELRAAAEILLNEQSRTDISNPLINAVSTALKKADTLMGLQGDDCLWRKELSLITQLRSLKMASEGRQLALEQCRQVAAALVNGVAEAQDFKVWLMSLAQKVAEAFKEDRFLGIGGACIFGSERVILADLETALGVSV